MVFGGVNYLAVLIAAIVAFGVGAVWYGVLVSKPWMKAARLAPEDIKPSPAPYIISLAGELVMAWVLAGVIGHLGPGQVTLWNGVVSGFFVWLGFMFMTMMINHRYHGYGWDLTLIDGGHWLLVALAMGAVIGFMGV
ncbi:MAG: DUF1761 domain-containing protein [Pseudomonadota bacterium]|nr:DUF1761 domain-containing protein [Pseudomonadota bacterium]